MVDLTILFEPSSGSSEAIGAVAAALVGAVVGTVGTAFTSYLLQRTQAAERRREDLLGQAVDCLARLRAVLTRLEAVERDLEEMRRTLGGGSAEPSWTWVLPMISGRHVDLSPQNYTVILQLEDRLLLRRVQIGFSDFAVVMQLLDLYRDRRPQLTQLIPARRENGKATFELSAEDRMKLESLMGDLDSLAGLIFRDVAEARVAVDALLRELAAAFASHFKAPELEEAFLDMHDAKAPDGRG
ncbi:MAG: hypothetical protein LPK04_08675 [Caulobacteraceae bacterium]|nr:hypothetical protein [Caulobacteraceae bacterium]